MAAKAVPYSDGWMSHIPANDRRSGGDAQRDPLPGKNAIAAGSE